MEALILVATLGGPTMFARIGVMRALNRNVVREFNPVLKETHWGGESLSEICMTDIIYDGTEKVRSWKATIPTASPKPRPVCQEWFDMRDIGQMAVHIHDAADVEIGEGPEPPPREGPVH
jgi:hypothetical protein